MSNVAVLFMELRKIARELKDTSTGNGRWSAEANCGDDVICYQQYDCGYSQKLTSQKFDFVVWELNSNNETQYKFNQGSETDMVNCLEFLRGE